MASDSFESVAESARRRYYATHVLILVIVAVLGVATTEIYSQIPFIYDFPVLASVLLWGVGFLIPLVRPSSRRQLTTDKDPETVRNEFLGPDNPLLGYRRGAVDKVERLDSTTEFRVTTLFRTKTLRFTVEERGEDIELDVAYNGRNQMSYRITIEQTEEGTLVRPSVSWMRRMSIRDKWLMGAMARCQIRAYRLHGYRLDSER